MAVHGRVSLSSPHVEVAIRHRLGSLTVDMAFSVHAGWTVLFGPSGSGKSTALRAVAGLFRPESGRIAILGEVVSDSEGGVWKTPAQRRMRWAGQRTALFPRKTVRWNIAMGMGNDGVFAGRGWIDELERGIEIFGLRDLSNKYPAQLSGGERQWVSVVRAAIGARGKILLLDEPFSGLDARVRLQLIDGLRLWLGDTPILSVTHDVGEAFLLGAEIVRIAEGSVVAQGPVEMVLAEERLRRLGQLGACVTG
jgi:molybdate transport system ATP-binding protein